MDEGVFTEGLYLCLKIRLSWYLLFSGSPGVLMRPNLLTSLFLKKATSWADNIHQQ